MNHHVRTREMKVAQEAREVVARVVQMYEAATTTADTIRVLLTEIEALRTRLPR